MVNIYYEVKVVYTDIFGVEQSSFYKVLSSSRENAVAIVKEYFLTAIGCYNDMKFLARAVKPTFEEHSHINNAINTIFGEIRKTFLGKNYKEFLQSFIDFNGYNFENRDGVVMYTVSFFSFEFRVLFRDGVCLIDDTEIIYNSTTFERSYVIRNNFMEFYIGK